MSPKIKIEENLPTGGKITITLEDSDISEEKVIQILNFIKSLTRSSYEEDRVRYEGKLTDIIWEIIFTKFGNGKWFTSKELYKALLEEGIEVDQRTISTYLLRFYRRGMLDRIGPRSNMRYKIKTPVVR